MTRFTLLVLFVLSCARGSLAVENELPPASGLDRLKADWKSVPSRVIGSPDPPLPYRVQRTLPELQLSNPICVAKEPDGNRLYFIDQDPNYRLCRTKADGSDGAFETLLDFDKEIAYSIAFHPNFSENGLLFIGSSNPVSEDGKSKHCRVTRYTVSRDAVSRDNGQQIDAATTLVIIQWESNGHNGAAVAFGLDGMLYVTSGDGTSDSDTNLTGQGLDHLLAKVLRINIDQPSAGQPYSVPSDNPFVDVAGARPETWAYGFRNPWRMSVDPRTGHLWVGNNGQDLWEQIYLVERGANYGWSVYEGGQIFYATRQLGPTPVSKPMFDHPHSEARSMTGGVVYYGNRHPELQGAYIYGDYSTGKIWGAKVTGHDVVWHKELADTTLAITAFGSDADGELLIADYRPNHEGGFYSLEVNDANDHSEAFPKLLSQTGMFTSVRGHQVAPGMIPYSVNAPLWSDGAYKERYLFLPPTTSEAGVEKPTTISMANNRGWDFPDRTVLVKSFAFDTPDDAGARRWIETRLLTKQQGEWVGYSYAWNDEQTDATLVAKDGLDREFVVRADSNESRSQAWRFPSRAECMMCHSRAANFVLGLSTLQMNKEHDFGGIQANQLEALAYLGVLQVAWTADARKQLGELLKSSGADDAGVKARSEELTNSQRLSEMLPSELPVHWSAAFPRLVDPADKKQDLDARARSYLHANCAQCHVEAGGGNSQIDLEFTKPLGEAKLVNEEPLHHKFDLPDARLIAAGDPDRSVLLHRLAIRGPGQMPQLATTKVDATAVELLREWISQLK